MTISHQPSVFLSSTCYDLAQIRKDLSLFIELMGMTPVLSELNSFPVNPDIDVIANCLASVKDKADIFVIIVGGHYGSQDKTGKSITNMEYFEAKAKGIPRYVFVQKQILTALPIWKKNPSGDFLDIVDSPKLFEFVETLRDPKENWVFPFESAQDIIETLRKQFAYLFTDALSIRRKFIQTDLPENLKDLSGIALQYVIQKPFAWEYLLFNQILCDEIYHLRSLRKDLDYGITLGRTIRLRSISEVMDWIRRKMGEGIAFVHSISQLIDVAFVKAVGAPGEPGDTEEIVYVAKRLASTYRSILEWTIDFKHIQVDDEFGHLLEIASRMLHNSIKEIEDFSIKSKQQLIEAIKRYECTKEPISLTAELKLTCPDMSDFDNEIRRVSKLFGIEL